MLFKITTNGGFIAPHNSSYLVEALSCATHRGYELSGFFRELATRIMGASVIQLILHILLMGAKKQMGGLHASRSITKVENVHTFRDFAIAKLPRNAMRQLLDMVSAMYAQLPVTFVVLSGSPQPATSFSSVNFSPKAGWHSFIKFHNNSNRGVRCILPSPKKGG